MIDHNNNQWNEYLMYICMGYNTLVHEGNGYTPFELTFGQANLPSSVVISPNMIHTKFFTLWKNRHDKYLQKSRRIIERQKKRYQREQNRRIIRTQSLLNIGDQVLVHNDHKMHKLDVE